MSPEVATSQGSGDLFLDLGHGLADVVHCSLCHDDQEATPGNCGLEATFRIWCRDLRLLVHRVFEGTPRDNWELLLQGVFMHWSPSVFLLSYMTGR